VFRCTVKKIIIFVLILFTCECIASEDEINADDYCSVEQAYLSEKGAIQAHAEQNKDFFCFVSFENSKFQHAQIVDLRLSEDFYQGRIPGSINVSSETLPYKSFLKNKPLLLVADGFGRVKESKLCSSLLDAGFTQAKILRDGMRSWLAHGKPFQALSAYPNGFSTIKSEDVLHEFQFSRIKIVSLNRSFDKRLESFFGEISRVNLSENIDDLWQRLLTVSEKSNSVGGGAINVSKHYEDIPIVLVGMPASYLKIQQFRVPDTLTHTYFLKNNVASLSKHRRQLEKIKEAQAKIPNRYRCQS